MSYVKFVTCSGGHNTFRHLDNSPVFFVVTGIIIISNENGIRNKLFKNGPSKICGRRPLKNLK